MPIACNRHLFVRDLGIIFRGVKERLAQDFFVKSHCLGYNLTRNDVIISMGFINVVVPIPETL